MFNTGLYTTVKGYSAKEAIMKYAPDGRIIAEIRLGVGDGSIKYPTMWVNVPVWEGLAEEVLEVIKEKGVRVEVTGMLQVRMYEGTRGIGVAIELKNVREVKIYDRDGKLEKVLSEKKGSSPPK